MDSGYVITPTALEALAAFGAPGVRHCAALGSGEGFIAFTGTPPADGLLLHARPEEVAWWFQVRRIAPTSADETEHLALVTVEGFERLLAADVLAVTPLTNGLRLVQTSRPIADALWSASSTRILDTRLAVGAGA